MTVTVLYFGILREAAGRASDACELPNDATAQVVVALVRERLPQMQALLERSAIAVNQMYAAPDTELHDGDEIALLPPVSGGSVGIV